MRFEFNNAAERSPLGHHFDGNNSEFIPLGLSGWHSWKEKSDHPDLGFNVRIKCSVKSSAKLWVTLGVPLFKWIFVSESSSGRNKNLKNISLACREVLRQFTLISANSTAPPTDQEWSCRPHSSMVLRATTWQSLDFFFLGKNSTTTSRCWISDTSRGVHTSWLAVCRVFFALSLCFFFLKVQSFCFQRWDRWLPIESNWTSIWRVTKRALWRSLTRFMSSTIRTIQPATMSTNWLMIKKF